ncbi:MAG: hypothetical protein ABR875_00165 [Minisyncoccia bacterium]|jgi:uncharacterized membrane protein affecting hemolysin expression
MANNYGVNINLNQNLWFLIIGFLGIFINKYLRINNCIIYFVSMILSFSALVSVLYCLFYYTIRYGQKKETERLSLKVKALEEKNKIENLTK